MSMIIQIDPTIHSLDFIDQQLDQNSSSLAVEWEVYENLIKNQTKQ